MQIFPVSHPPQTELYGSGDAFGEAFLYIKLKKKKKERGEKIRGKGEREKRKSKGANLSYQLGCLLRYIDTKLKT